LFTVSSNEVGADRILIVPELDQVAKLIGVPRGQNDRRVVQVVENSFGRFSLSKDADMAYLLADEARMRLTRLQATAPSPKIDNVEIVFSDDEVCHFMSSYGDGETAFVTTIPWSGGSPTRYEYRDVFPGPWFYPDTCSASYCPTSRQFGAFSAGIVEDMGSGSYCLAASVFDEDGTVVEAGRLMLDDADDGAMGFVQYGRVVVTTDAPLLIVTHRAMNGVGLKNSVFSLGRGELAQVGSLPEVGSDAVSIVGSTSWGGLIATGRGNATVDILEYA
jgi:hypothetical protein